MLYPACPDRARAARCLSAPTLSKLEKAPLQGHRRHISNTLAGRPFSHAIADTSCGALSARICCFSADVQRRRAQGPDTAGCASQIVAGASFEPHNRLWLS